MTRKLEALSECVDKAVDRTRSRSKRKRPSVVSSASVVTWQAPWRGLPMPLRRHLKSAARISSRSRVTIVVVGHRRYSESYMSYARGRGTSVLTGDAEMVVGTHPGRIAGAHKEWIDGHEGRCRAGAPIASAGRARASIEDVIHEGLAAGVGDESVAADDVIKDVVFDVVIARAAVDHNRFLGHMVE